MIITIRIYNQKGKLVARRIGPRENWKKLHGKLASAAGYKWYIRAVYGYDIDTYGKRNLFKNEGIYFNVKEAKQALSAFIEK